MCSSLTKLVDFGDLKKDAVFRSECNCQFICTWVITDMSSVRVLSGRACV
jgi:hypothetical protein